jgi:hypothetical protein
MYLEFILELVLKKKRKCGNFFLVYSYDKTHQILYSIFIFINRGKLKNTIPKLYK